MRYPRRPDTSQEIHVTIRRLAPLAALLVLVGAGCAHTTTSTTVPATGPEKAVAASPSSTSASAPVAAASPTKAPGPASPVARAADAPLSPAATVRAGLVGAVPNAGIYLAEEKGYFREQGLAVEI